MWWGPDQSLLPLSLENVKMTTFRKASENRLFKFLQEEVSKKWEKKWKGNKSMWEREREKEGERERENIIDHGECLEN